MFPTGGGLGHLQCLLDDVSPHPPGAIHQHHLLKHTPHLGNKMAEGGRREEGEEEGKRGRKRREGRKRRREGRKGGRGGGGGKER